ncbi:MAG: xanthine dehydrogenase family protein subunit M [Hyphomicrobiales bacterium]|nr:xanthine dehydrogenase family protein subunit M [Hyphomicrobiales bacterium]MCP5370368.1 xanthine dehydrogenase family protein subunit M [Hyphomicrobiales bacterium]
MGYYSPRSLEDALNLAAAPGRRIIAGGTDFYPAQGDRPLTDDVIDITAIDGLRAITADNGAIRIGAAATWTDLVDAPLPPACDGLKMAAREVGGVQIQNAATVAGNLCNASPAADGVPPLLTLDAAVEVAAPGGRRTVPLADFITGNRRTVLAPGEIVTAIVLPAPAAGARGHFVKLGARRHLVISIAMVAVVLEPGAGGTVAAARIAVGACSPVARRLADLEADLAGAALDGGLGARVAEGHLAVLSPIDDIRATAAYRRDAARTLVARCLDACAAEMTEKTA